MPHRQGWRKYDSIAVAITLTGAAALSTFLIADNIVPKEEVLSGLVLLAIVLAVLRLLAWLSRP